MLHLLICKGAYGDASVAIAQASSRYGQAIRLLSRNLTDERLCYDPGNEAAILLLYFYEVRQF